MYTFIDWILFILLALCVGYLLFYAIASKFYRPRKLSEARIQRRFLVLFPAYKEDRVIVSTIRSFLKQEYPKEMYDVLVISDQMQPDTNAALQALPICLQVAGYTNSSKAKALTLAMNVTANESYDVVVIMDADNVTTPNFLAEINRAFDSGLHAVQAHRTGKHEYRHRCSGCDQRRNKQRILPQRAQRDRIVSRISRFRNGIRRSLVPPKCRTSANIGRRQGAGSPAAKTTHSYRVSGTTARIR